MTLHLHVKCLCMPYRMRKFIFLVLCCCICFSRTKAGIIQGYNSFLDNLTKHKSINAVVIYRKDTIKGRALFLYDAYAPRGKGQWQEQCYRMFLLLKNKDSTYKINVADTDLTRIFLSDSAGKKLLLVKFPHINTFLRVIHTGKLCIYDCIYSFSYRHTLNIHSWSYHSTLLSSKLNPFPDSVSNGSLHQFEKTVPLGKDVTVASCLSWQNLIHAINETYHLQINTEDYKRKGREKKLYALVSSLD